MAAPLTRSDYERLVQKATDEKGEEDWAVIMDICDKAGQGIHGPKDCLHECLKRLKTSSPNVQSKTLTLLDALVQNCGSGFHNQVATKDFASSVTSYIPKAAHSEKVKLLKMLKSWCEKEFKGNPSYSVIPNLCQKLKEDGHFSSASIHVSSDAFATASSSRQGESADPDLEKAIELSLKEAQKTASLYPTMTLTDSSPGQLASNNIYATVGTGSSHHSVSREPRKVRALYDFVAAEDNELTFTSGELVDVIDDSDVNWWKGRSWRGEGLFPSNFVTSDLNAAPEEEHKSVQFNEVVEVKQLDPDTVQIDESKIDEALALIQNADPTGENEADSSEMLTLEEECKIMGSLIDADLERVDTSHSELMALHSKLVESVNLYMELMAEVPPQGPMPSAKALPGMYGAGQPPQQPYMPAVAMYGAGQGMQLPAHLASQSYGGAFPGAAPNLQSHQAPNVQTSSQLQSMGPAHQQPVFPPPVQSQPPPGIPAQQSQQVPFQPQQPFPTSSVGAGGYGSPTQPTYTGAAAPALQAPGGMGGVPPAAAPGPASSGPTYQAPMGYQHTAMGQPLTQQQQQPLL